MSRRKEPTPISPPGQLLPTAPLGNKFTSFFRKLTSRFSRTKKHIPATAQNKLAARTYEFVDPNRLRVSPSPKPRYGYINGSPRSSYAPPSPSWLSRNVSRYPRARHRSYTEFAASLGVSNSLAIHSTLLPSDLTGTLPRHPPISHIGPVAVSTPKSPQLAPLPPPLPTQQSSAVSRPLTIHHYRPPTPPKGRGKQHIRVPFLLPRESILEDLTSKKPTQTHHGRSNSTLNSSATVS